MGVSFSLPAPLFFFPSLSEQEQRRVSHTGVGRAGKRLGVGRTAVRNGSNLFQGCDKSPGLELRQFRSPSWSSAAFSIAACLFSLIILN